MILTSNNTIPDSNIIEAVILERLIAKHGDIYINLFMNDWLVESCDEQKLIMHCNSPFHCEVIRKRLLPDITHIIHSVYGIQPCISITIIE
jgi:hypothetical protein